MDAKLLKYNDEHHVIEWNDGDQFGEIDFKWDNVLDKYIVDTEMLGIESIIKIIQAIKI